MKFTFIDLFAGIGGFKIALTNNGGHCLAFSEIDKDAIVSYCENLKIDSTLNLGDITQIKTLPDHDLLVAGVPCQSWSIAGKNLGFDDDRGQLWNDTIYLLQQSQPNAFIFENVKGLADPRNEKALLYILDRIKKAGYYANYFVINSHEYGVLQNRIRVYIIGFKEEHYFLKFSPPRPIKSRVKLGDLLGIEVPKDYSENFIQKDLFGNVVECKTMSLSNTNGFNDYFLFNDIRNGHTTIHSWDIIDTSKRQKQICLLLLKNRRKPCYGQLDGNPLSLEHFQDLDPSITQADIDQLVALEILKSEEYRFVIQVEKITDDTLNPAEKTLLSSASDQEIIIDQLKMNRLFKIQKISIPKTIQSLQQKDIITCCETRYDFKHSKISTGLFGISRIFLPTSDIFPTLVASDTNDFVSLQSIQGKNQDEFKETFIREIYRPQRFRKITRGEACLIQGFPENYKLPESRVKWMKLIGNSVSVPVIDQLCQAIIKTGVFGNKN